MVNIGLEIGTWALLIVCGALALRRRLLFLAEAGLLLSIALAFVVPIRFHAAGVTLSWVFWMASLFPVFLAVLVLLLRDKQWDTATHLGK